jgi:hypothetical protein
VVKTTYQWVGIGDPWEVNEVKEVREVNEVKERACPRQFDNKTHVGLALRILYLLTFINVIYFSRRSGKMTGLLRD